jgi:hypothetical protein
MRQAHGIFCFLWSHMLILPLSKLLFVEEAFLLHRLLKLIRIVIVQPIDSIHESSYKSPLPLPGSWQSMK